MPPSRDDPISPLVLQQYGWAMLQVQAFERTLALLSLTLTPRASQRKIKDAAGLTRALDKIKRRVAHAFERASIAELRKLLPADFDPILMAEIEKLIPTRDRLAHRYLVELLAASVIGIPPSTGGRVAELRSLGSEFMATGLRLGSAQKEAMARLPTLDAPPELVELMRGMAPQMFLRGPAGSTRRAG